MKRLEPAADRVITRCITRSMVRPGGNLRVIGTEIIEGIMHPAEVETLLQRCPGELVTVITVAEAGSPKGCCAHFEGQVGKTPEHWTLTCELEPHRIVNEYAKTRNSLDGLDQPDGVQSGSAVMGCLRDHSSERSRHLTDQSGNGITAGR